MLEVNPPRSSSLLPSSAQSPKERPTSWMSIASTSSVAPSPLFDKEMFDAFPSVPQDTPPIPPSAYGNFYGRPSLPESAFSHVPVSPLSSDGHTPTQLHPHKSPLNYDAKSLGRAATLPRPMKRAETSVAAMS